jgi:hypothetical protein
MLSAPLRGGIAKSLDSDAARKRPSSSVAPVNVCGIDDMDSFLAAELQRCGKPRHHCRCLRGPKRSPLSDEVVLHVDDDHRSLARINLVNSIRHLRSPNQMRKVSKRFEACRAEGQSCFYEVYDASAIGQH